MALFPSSLPNSRKDTRTVGHGIQSIFLIGFTLLTLTGIEARLSYLQIVEGSQLRKRAESNRVLWLCHKYLTPKYREYIEKAQNTKNVYHIRSTKQISEFLKLIENETKFKDGASA